MSMTFRALRLPRFPQLFNLKTDRTELHNLAASQPQRAERARRQMRGMGGADPGEALSGRRREEQGKEAGKAPGREQTAHYRSLMRILRNRN